MSARRTVLALAALAVLLPLPAAPALACSCAAQQDDRTALAGSDVVVSGEVLERREPGFRLAVSSGDPAVYVLRVERVHKGDAARVVEVETAQSGASCGLELPGSGPALLFLREDAGRLHGGLCDGSRTADDAEVVAALGEGRPPSDDAAAPGAPDPGLPAGPVAAAGALSALTLLGVLLVAGRSRRLRPA